MNMLNVPLPKADRFQETCPTYKLAFSEISNICHMITRSPLMSLEEDVKGLG